MKARTSAKTKSGVNTYKPWVLRQLSTVGRDNMGITEEFRDRWKRVQSKSKCKKQGHPGYFRLINIAPFYSKQVEHDRLDLLKGQGEP